MRLVDLDGHGDGNIGGNILAGSHHAWSDHRVAEVGDPHNYAIGGNSEPVRGTRKWSGVNERKSLIRRTAGVFVLDPDASVSR